MRAPFVSATAALLIAAIVLGAGRPFSVWADESLADRIRQREKELEAQRELRDPALAIRQKEVELEEQRRSLAAKELEALRSRRETLEKRIAYARKAVLASFDMADRVLTSKDSGSASSGDARNGRRGRNSRGADPQRLPQSLERSKRLRETMLKQLLAFRGDSGNYIADGTALNFFLQLCGPAAFAGDFYRGTAGSKGSGEAEGLGGLTDQYRISPEILRHIRYQRGLSGPKLSGRLNEDPLDTDWPAILRSEKFQSHTRDIETGRAEVFKALRYNNGVPAKVADGLLDSVRDLLTAIQDEESELMRQIRSNGSASRVKEDWFRLHRSEAPIRVLLAGCYRLIEARQIEDVSLPPLDAKKGVTVEKLIAYMHENNLYFNPSGINDQTAYNTIFELMSRYYVGLSQLKFEVENEERQAEALRQEEARVNEVALGNKLNNIQQTEVAVAQAKATAAMAGLLSSAISAASH